jgi:hypothetical protein
MGPIAKVLLPIFTNIRWPLSWLPVKGLRQTPTDSQPSGKNLSPSDWSVAGESSVETLFTRSNTFDSYVASPPSLHSEDVWSYAKLSMTNEDAWARTPHQVRAAAHNYLLYSHAF